MNTLSDLRSTLDAHADRIPDGETVVRAAAVHHRVSVVRRRRRAVGAGALALVVATTIGVVGVQRDSSTPPPVVFGVRAPETITSLGYTYRTDGRAETFAGRGSVAVSASSAPRLYSWTTDRPVTVRMVLPNGEAWTSQRSRFTDFVQVPAGQSGTLRVSVPAGSVGLASYALTDAAPAGYTKNGSTYRQSVDGTPLLAAAISDEGRPELRTSYVATGGRVDLRLACSGLPKGYAVNLSLNGDGRLSSSGGSCGAGNWLDPGSSSVSELRDRPAGTTVHVRVWVSTGFGSGRALPASAVPGLRLGIGVYGPAVSRRVGGYRLPIVVEQDGHTWALTSSRSSDGPPLRLQPAGGDRVAGMAWRIRGRAEVEFRAGATATPSGSDVVGGTAAMGSLWVPAGQTPRARILKGTGTFGVAMYERTD
jgi:hypothetical protein